MNNFKLLCLDNCVLCDLLINKKEEVIKFIEHYEDIGFRIIIPTSVIAEYVANAADDTTQLLKKIKKEFMIVSFCMTSAINAGELYKKHRDLIKKKEFGNKQKVKVDTQILGTSMKHNSRLITNDDPFYRFAKSCGQQVQKTEQFEYQSEIDF